jgi:flavin reductase (DIM6/NTAB) family NADH-FMN oxidoreductase RutF
MQESEVSQCAILPDIASYLECEVVDRMDAGDHSVVYATIADGKVVDTDSLSAVHYRKVGTSY